MARSIADRADGLLAGRVRRDWLLALLEHGCAGRSACAVFAGLVEACSGVHWTDFGPEAYGIVHDLAAAVERPKYGRWLERYEPHRNGPGDAARAAWARSRLHRHSAQGPARACLAALRAAGALDVAGGTDPRRKLWTLAGSPPPRLVLGSGWKTLPDPRPSLTAEYRERLPPSPRTPTTKSQPPARRGPRLRRMNNGPSAVRDERIRKGLTQLMAASEADVALNTWKRAERKGIGVVARKQRVAIARALGVDVAELLRRDDEARAGCGEHPRRKAS